MTSRRKNDYSVDVYVPFVETLFRDGLTLSIGFASQTLLVVLCYLKTSQPAYLVVACALLVVAVLRLRNMRKNRNAPQATTWKEARRRENDYILYGSMHGMMLGIFCFVGIYVAPDPFAEIAAVSVTLASATAISGRNYGSPRMVMIFIISMTGPISVGFMLRGDPYHLTLGLLSVALFVAIKRFADLVREVLFKALSEQKKADSLAQRFNRALNTMSHGLVMLAPDGKIVVANAEAASLMALKSTDKLLGRSIHALLMRGVAGGMLAAKDCRFIESQLTRALSEGRNRKVLVSLSNGQHYEFSAREGSQELGVITFEDVTARIEAEEKIRTMARYDSLTALPNRAYFQEIVAESLAAGDRNRLCGIAVLDLDDFKSVNDTLGHPIGDGLIYAVAEKLASFSGDTIKVSRFGGDEFMVFFDHIEDESHLATLLDSIFAGLQGDVDVAGHALRVQLSGGAVISRVKDTEVDAMIVKADLALYKAKELGKNDWRLFESAMDAAFRNRQLLKADLRVAIESRLLRIVYQPIIALDTMRIAHCEALCRWDHHDMGPISPGIFIPLAEEMGLISEITAHVLETACIECAKWPGGIGVSVNLSARDFRNRDIIDRLRDVLVKSGLDTSRLELEVTETALLDDKAMTRRFMEEIRQLGVRVALDDFGTGYSSLSYLHSLPLDKVKIDRSFLMDVTRSTRSLELLKGIVNLSRPMGLKITVEGVETFEQFKILSDIVKPDYLQGFLFGSALSSSGIGTMAHTVWPSAEADQKHKQGGRAPIAASS
ncbi:MAG: EAL domain-containing protein [Rhizobiaceae bacterium]|nr:EAL domain-containing protein [Rhizobiaceae bacterium]